VAEQKENNVRNGLGVTHYTWQSATDAIRLDMKSMTPTHVVTLTPEMCVRADSDPEFNNIIKDARLVVADGVGVVWGEGRRSGSRPEKIPGIELAEWSLDELNRNSGRVYLLGSKESVISPAAEYVRKNYPHVKVVGCHNGYFKPEEKSRIVSEIAGSNPNLVLVGLGSPKQEIFISKNLTVMNCGVAIGVGGTLDVFAGNVKRAPGFFRKTGTEWVYRTLSEPKKRIGRLPDLFKFIGLVLSKR
jgi:N-acetylglucosaminyldiphosphoundecaprenol N-acetyl-beta-D-mannosaminyltransferase